jgi:hypothetical protein
MGPAGRRLGEKRCGPLRTAHEQRERCGERERQYPIRRLDSVGTSHLKNPTYPLLIEQNRLCHSLEQTHQVIVTPNVGEFVSENRLHLRRR